MRAINVTKTFLPPIEEYTNYLKQIWETGQLTNQGPLLRQFEAQVSSFLAVEYFHFVSNGTIAIQIALRALGITEGEVITTPFTYVATTSALLWERCTPVFVDIDPTTFCIDADKIEQAITNDTKAILAVHVYGFACNVKKIEQVAKKYKLKVIYDAAHAFGAAYDGRSLLSYGDAATCSFHATKLFHTIEGGCVTTNDAKVSNKLELMKRFGHNGDDHIMLGINAKASEFQAAMGLSNLKYIGSIKSGREAIYRQYDAQLSDRVRKPIIPKQGTHNYAYYPIVFSSEQELLVTLQKLHEESIFPRRYFYPSLNMLPYIRGGQKCPISESIAQRVLCLPLYMGLSEKDVAKICNIINA